MKGVYQFVKIRFDLTKNPKASKFSCDSSKIITMQPFHKFIYFANSNIHECMHSIYITCSERS